METTKPRRQDRHAGFISRAIGFVIDLVVMSVAVFGVIALTQSVIGFFTLYGLIGQRLVNSDVFRTIVVVGIAIVSAAIAIGYPVGFWVVLGQTPGKILIGVRVVRANGKPLTVRRALLRYLGYWLSLIPLGLGFLWVLIDDRRQGWHDKLADTYVIYESQSIIGQKLLTPQPLPADGSRGYREPA